MTDVVAALIWDKDRFLACQRPVHKARGLLWEFVGGKVEHGETKQQALIRECQEELGVIVQPGEVFMELVHEYPDITVRLTLFNAVISQGIPKRLEHNDIRWITTSEIDDYEFCPADKDILKKLKGVRSGIQAELLSQAEEDYKQFQCALMPTVDPGSVLGVRMPAVRKLAGRIKNSSDAEWFLSDLPHTYYEEDNLHGILICGSRDFAETVRCLDAFLPFVNNWATCDLLTPGTFAAHPAGLIEEVNRWLRSCHAYTVRFGIGVLMKFYLDSAFSEEYIEMAASVQSDDYYVKMMIAWYFATALTKQYDSAVKYLENHRMDTWVHNKAIQKAVESCHIPVERKSYLKTLRRK